MEYEKKAIDAHCIELIRALKFLKKTEQDFQASVHDAVQRVLDTLQDEAPLAGITVLKILPSDLIPAPLSAPHLESLVYHTLYYFRSRMENAQKYGTGLIHIEAGDKNYISPENPNQKRFVLRISHNGPEIDKKELPDLFDPFCSSAVNGLGLHLCEKIADYYGGTVQIETNSRSTLFQFEFPA